MIFIFQLETHVLIILLEPGVILVGWKASDWESRWRDRLCFELRGINYTYWGIVAIWPLFLFITYLFYQVVFLALQILPSWDSLMSIALWLFDLCSSSILESQRRLQGWRRPSSTRPRTRASSVFACSWNSFVIMSENPCLTCSFISVQYIPEFQEADILAWLYPLFDWGPRRANSCQNRLFWRLIRSDFDD